MSKQLKPGDFCTIPKDKSGAIYKFMAFDKVSGKYRLQDPVTGNDTYTRSEPIKATRPTGKASAEALILDQADEIRALKDEAEKKAEEYGKLAVLCDAQAEAIDAISQTVGGPSSAQGIDLDKLVEQVKALAAKAESVPTGSVA